MSEGNLVSGLNPLQWAGLVPPDYAAPVDLKPPGAQPVTSPQTAQTNDVAATARRLAGGHDPAAQKPPDTVIAPQQKGDPLDAVMQKIAGGESGHDPDAAHLLHGPGGNHFGFPTWEGFSGPAGRSHAAGLYGFEPATWQRAAQQWAAANPGQPPPDFNNKEDQTKIGKFHAANVYRQKTGRDLATDAAAGNVNYAALESEWPSLNPHHAMHVGWADKDRTKHEEAMNSATEIQREFLRQANEETPGSQQRQELLFKAREAADRASESFERLRKTPPYYQPADIMENFGSAAVLISIIGGLFARRPLTASLQAAGLAMQAQNQQRWDLFKSATDQWKTQADMGLAQSRLAHDQIREVMDDEKLAFNEKEAKLTRLLSAWQIGEQAKWHQETFAAQRMDAWNRLNQHAEDMQQRWEEHVDATSEKLIEQQIFAEVTKARQQVAKGEPKAEENLAAAQQKLDDFNRTRGKGLSSANNPANDAYQQFLREYPEATAEQRQAFQQLSRAPRSAPAQYMQQWRTEHPHAGSEEAAHAYATFMAGIGASRALTYGKQGDTVRVFSVAIDHLKTLEDAALELKNGRIPAFNALAQRYAQATGEAAPTTFDAVKTAVGSEISKAITGSAGALTDREEYRGALSKASSPDQLVGPKGVIHAYKQLMAGQLHGFQRQFQDFVTPEEFDKKLSPLAKQELEAATRQEREPGGTRKHTATGQNGAKVYSDDGVTWFNEDGSPYK